MTGSEYGDKILNELEKKGQMVAHAIAFATKAHEGQFRKGTKRPYIVHPLEVGEIVATLTFDEEIISAALLKYAPYEVRMIGLADKLSNIRDIDRDYPVMGEELWNRFRMKEKNTIGWYYKGLRESLREGFEQEEAFREYSYLVDKNFGIDESSHI